jgi:hypothetical protein
VTALPSEDEPERSAGPPGDDAQDHLDEDDAIHFHFPIDIQLVGGSDGELVDQVVTRVFDELRRELERQA